jgi:hypothetical protein
MINVTYELDGTIDEKTAARAVEKVLRVEARIEDISRRDQG